jgi:hypothetical protein
LRMPEKIWSRGLATKFGKIFEGTTVVDIMRIT